MVCSEAAGEAATAALVQYLREQRVMKVSISIKSDAGIQSMLQQNLTIGTPEISNEGHPVIGIRHSTNNDYKWLSVVPVQGISHLWAKFVGAPSQCM